MSETRRVNRLAAATSPYLLQHADNPVDWWEWSPEAFEEARRRHVPVLLSVGYAACHWCHVMAHESFEDEATAAYLNEHFVSIKVDREERPDVDAIYMQATTAMTGSGGWPMTVVLDHEGSPWFAGTYFPDTPRHGQASFRQVLQALVEAWRDRADGVREQAAKLREHLQAAAQLPSSPIGRDDLDAAVTVLAAEFDPVAGGFGGAPKFPPSMVLEFLLRHGSDEALRMVDHTIDAMVRGGLHDQLGGGFARYSVDARWVVPHFEKMLYDNALLMRVFADRRTPPALWAAEGIAEFLLRELRTAEGGFASALDADSQGQEGVFYVWTPQQLVEALGEDDGAWAAELFSVTDTGTFEHGSSVLQLLEDPDDVDRWLDVRARLLAARSARVRPERDDKVVAAWNGLAISGLARLSTWLEEPRLPGRRRRCCRAPAGRAPRGRPAPAGLTRWRRRCSGRRAGGPRVRRRGPARPLPGHRRRPLAECRHRPPRHGARPLRGRGRWLLRHRRRRRAAGGPSTRPLDNASPSGQSVAAPCPGHRRRDHRRAALPRGRRGRPRVGVTVSPRGCRGSPAGRWLRQWPSWTDPRRSPSSARPDPDRDSLTNKRAAPRDRGRPGRRPGPATASPCWSAVTRSTAGRRRTSVGTMSARHP